VVKRVEHVFCLFSKFMIKSEKGVFFKFMRKLPYIVFCGGGPLGDALKHRSIISTSV